ncbi:MAG: LLM class flavin-dependent oxidoreductase [Betaproteobacteria bacterium]|nr:LLM class flavin-dependent oxidoreductase [Betaproteobacteria bacterium]
MSAMFDNACAMARIADKLGYKYLTKGQHYSSGPVQAFQQFPFLARMMAETANMKLVTGINLLPLHKPLDIAEQLATIDVMSRGRLVYGCGIGYRDVEFKAFGMDAKERGRRFEENLIAIKRLWTEDSVSMKGSHFELDNASASLQPVQKPTPPIWIGANVDAGIERSARMADAWFINPHQRLDILEAQLVIYKAALDKAGKPMPAILPMMRECFVARTTEKALRLARPYLETKYKSYREWGQDKSMAKGDDDLSLSFEQLIDQRFLVGSVENVAEQIVAYKEKLGISTLIVSFQQIGTPHQQVLDTLHLFAEEVMPAVRQALSNATVHGELPEMFFRQAGFVDDP